MVGLAAVMAFWLQEVWAALVCMGYQSFAPTTILVSTVLFSHDAEPTLQIFYADSPYCFKVGQLL